MASNLMMDNRVPGPFKEYLDTSPGPRWVVWKRDFELIMKANKIPDEDRDVWLLAQGGPDIQKLNEFLPECTGEGISKMTTYEKLILRLDQYFKPKVLLC
jgi:hypothetical protein